MVEAKAQGRREDEYGESATMWAVFDRKEVEARLAGSDLSLADISKWDDRDYQDLVYDLSGFHSSYGGPGRWFWNEPHMKVGRNRVLIRVSGGLDI